MQDLSQVERRVEGLVVKGKQVQTIVHHVEAMVGLVGVAGVVVRGHLDMQDVCQVERRVEGLVVKGKQVQTVVQQVEAMAWLVVKGH